MSVPSQFCGQNIGKYNRAVVLFKKFYFHPLKSHVVFLKRLIEGKKFCADAKCEDQVMVKFDGHIVFVGNEHTYGDKSFLE
jgi:hypothetical protein